MAEGYPHVDLIWLSPQTPPPAWPLGEVIVVAPTPGEVHTSIQERLPYSSALAWLFWDGAFGAPEPEGILAALERPGDVWHAGLRLGMGGLPQIIDYVAPTWMLNCDPDPDIEATSWRLSLRCCLTKTTVLQKMGDIRPEFQTLAGAALEMGHRYIKRGVLIRHLPSLLPQGINGSPPHMPFQDELRLIYYRHGVHWCLWALLRALLTRAVQPTTAWQAWKTVGQSSIPPTPKPFYSDFSLSQEPTREASISILIPTLERYPYLHILLEQLRLQRVKPKEIIIIDQTSKERRDVKIRTDFADLPIKWLYLDETGQCLSRNAGLREVTGDFVLFLDDDDEVDPELIARHLASLMAFRSEVSAGVARVAIEGDLPEDFTFIRASDVFPTNNSLIEFKILTNSGLFDLAYNKLPRADGDLGMRLYLSGALMVLNPHISVIHHHAPAGGLRQHKARVITYASSRKKLLQRHLPNKSEIYLAKRYFTPRQVTEGLWLRALGTLGFKGPWWRRLLKIIISGLLLPDTLWQIRQRHKEAEAMLQRFPDIPTLS